MRLKNHLSLFLYHERQRKGDGSSSMSCDMDAKERSPFIWASLGREGLKTNVLREGVFKVVYTIDIGQKQLSNTL